MRYSIRFLRAFLPSEDATTTVEYAVLLGLIIAGVISAIGQMGAQTGGMWGGISADLDRAGLSP